MTDQRPFQRVLIANRGEIAVRIARTCRELGVETVAVYSDADRDALHVRLADQAIRLGPAPATESYLRADLIVRAATEAGAQAVHPGYGFLSEQSTFGAAVEAAGLAFVGPSPETLASLGDKLAARRSARAAGVPIVPGTFEPLPADDASELAAIEETAVALGFPLLIKASAGGGGRGMRRVDEARELPAAITAAAYEARQAFGDGAVYLERLVEGGRHIEVQLLGDSEGSIVALGERDCSTQRRHQKLVEEAPAPGLDRDQRQRLHELAVKVAADAGLRNAATAEFLYTSDGDFYFLEVNARLQVEHGVTELVTGLDLVSEQLSIAAGRPLSDAVLDAAEVAATPARHAIEFRISAEDPARDFAPVPGTVSRWREPGGPGVRNDSGIEQGWRVTGDYDPLLTKVLIVASDRAAALARSRRALDELETGGVQTTLPFHRWLLDHPAFTEADLRTDLVDRDWDPGPLRSAAARRAAESVASAAWADGASVAAGRASAAAAGTAAGRASVDGATTTAGSSALAVQRSAVSRSGWVDGAGSPWRDAGRREATERW